MHWTSLRIVGRRGVDGRSEWTEVVWEVLLRRSSTGRGRESTYRSTSETTVNRRPSKRPVSGSCPTVQKYSRSGVQILSGIKRNDKE